MRAMVLMEGAPIGITEDSKLIPRCSVMGRAYFAGVAGFQEYNGRTRIHGNTGRTSSPPEYVTLRGQ